jgi:hypothetical protein
MKLINFKVIVVLSSMIFIASGGCGSDTSPDVTDNSCSLSDKGCDQHEDTYQPPSDLLDVVGQDTSDIGRDLVVTDGILPGEFGSPCSSNEDCIDGFCVEGVDGLICTKPCLTECPDDWVCRTVLTGGDILSLCIPSGVFLCRACTRNAQCADGLCVSNSEGQYCARLCSELNPCPDRYKCEEVTDSESSATSMQCLPDNGSCTCKVANEGEERTCAVENLVGTCLGFEKCSAETGWGACSALQPSVETCDGIDNDCNRVTDDNPEFPEGDCFNDVPDVGSCRGSWVCRGDTGWDCVGPIPKAEECNFLDDDCDTDADEDFKDETGRYVSLENCGQCGQSCVGLVPFSKTTICDVTKATPQCKVTECIQGYTRINDLLCAPVISSLCVPCVDDSNCGTESDKCIDFGSSKFCGRDCSITGPYGTECPSGYQCSDRGAGVLQCMPVSGTCECTVANDGIKRFCEKTNASGTCSGTEICDGNVGWTGCSARDASPEICDRIDNDCNGLVDDNPELPLEPCENIWMDPATSHEYICSADWLCIDTPEGRDWVCPAATPGPEVCNYQDDNCNGLTDEDFKVAGTNKYGTADNCGACNVSCAGRVAHATMMCETSVPQPVCIVDTCDEGWWKASDLSCSPFPNSQCLACSTDANCQIPGDACLPADSVENSYCLWDCSADALRPEVDPVRKTCPVGYYCRQNDSLGQPLFKCYPNSGACDCVAGDEGQVRACAVSNPSGRCFGQETCNPASGWSVCNARTPAAEVCNRLDDDCNGLVDESFPQFGASCSAGIGECLRSGTYVCNGTGSAVVCNAVAAGIMPEVCDRKDNNCDGQIDELFTDIGKICTSGVGECLRTGVYECNELETGVMCGAEAGTSVTEKCDNLDNDCDGQIDETFAAKGMVCSVGIGNCFASGVWVCSNDKLSVVCNAVEGASVVERCDGQDNDCDGSIDETFDVNSPCQDGLGDCLQNGVKRCLPNGSATYCDAVAGSPIAEKCDGRDNNCDGSIDETWPTKGAVCSTGNGECRANGVTVCNVAQTALVCNAVANPPLPELCDGLDNNCNNQVDETWAADKGSVCFDGVGQCQRSGTKVCLANGSGLYCTAVAAAAVAEACDGLDNDCDSLTDETFADKGNVCTSGLGQCVRSGTWICNAGQTALTCNAVAGPTQAETCDYLDNDCDGSTDETFKTGGQYVAHTACGNCFTNCTAIYDLANAYGECDATVTPTCIMRCDAGYYDLNGIPGDGCEFLLDTTGVYVSIDDPMAEDDASCGLAPSVIGSGQYPCMSIQHGISRAVTLGRPRVLVANGLYNESITISGTTTGGKSLLGGYRSDTWERDVQTTLTTIRGVSGAGHVMALFANAITTPTTVEGFVIQGASATGTGANSYAIYVKDSTSALQIRSNVIYAGSGGPGLSGSDGNPGQAGLNGAGGQGTRNIDVSTGSCWGDPTAGKLGNAGGLGGSKVCDNEGGGTTDVSGGTGGFTSCPAQNRQEGSNSAGNGPNGGTIGKGPHPGAGGPGGYGSRSSSSTCYPPTAQVRYGTPGAEATKGDDGAGGAGSASATGGVSANHWVGSQGSDGVTAGHGAGGGGGGGGAGNDRSSDNRDDFGGAGGGGGSGGCAGFKGGGGKAGGGSFGIFMTFADTDPANVSQVPVVADNIVRRGTGGVGGKGGNGGPGGDGGVGGAGGPVDTYRWMLFCVFAGEKGGAGSRGGHAGAGGGGPGGVSWDIYVNNKNSVSLNYATANSFQIPAGTLTGGPGGSGGLSSNTVNGQGGDGIVGEYGNVKLIP